MPEEVSIVDKGRHHSWRRCQSNFSEWKYKKGRKLNVITLYYGSALGLVEAGVLPKLADPWACHRTKHPAPADGDISARPLKISRIANPVDASKIVEHIDLTDEVEPESAPDRFANAFQDVKLETIPTEAAAVEAREMRATTTDEEAGGCETVAALKSGEIDSKSAVVSPDPSAKAIQRSNAEDVAAAVEGKTTEPGNDEAVGGRQAWTGLTSADLQSMKIAPDSPASSRCCFM
jgi:hypothetical protein